MLMITRNIDESVHIGDDISVVVLSVKGKQVRLGINAPKDVVIRRDELTRNSTWVEQTRNGRPDPI